MEYAATQGAQVTDAMTHKQELSNMLLLTAVGGSERLLCRGSNGTALSAVGVAAMGGVDGCCD